MTVNMNVSLNVNACSLTIGYPGMAFGESII